MQKVVRVVWFVLMIIPFAGAAQKLDTVPRLPEHYKNRLLAFKKEPVVDGSTVVIGNGLVEGGNWKKILGDSNVVNLGIEGDVTWGVLARLKDVSQRHPSKIILMIGLDDLVKRISAENVMENIFSIARKLSKGSPGAVVLVNGILPVNPGFKNFPKGFDQNDKIFEINEQLRRYAGRMGYTYVDMSAGFADQKGHLDTKYSTDGVHLNAAGYHQWSEKLKEKK